MSIKKLNESLNSCKQHLEDSVIQIEIEALDSITYYENLTINTITELLEHNEGSIVDSLMPVLLAYRNWVKAELKKWMTEYENLTQGVIKQTLRDIALYGGRNPQLLKKRAYLLHSVFCTANNTLFLDLFEAYKNSKMVIAQYASEVLDKSSEEKTNELKDAIDIEATTVGEEKLELSKIFDYKDMVRLAEKNGYIKVRTRGDHLIYKHSDSERIVVIPAHELKCGLMYTIQKQIYANREKLTEKDMHALRRQ